MNKTDVIKQRITDAARVSSWSTVADKLLADKRLKIELVERYSISRKMMPEREHALHGQWRCFIYDSQRQEVVATFWDEDESLAQDCCNYLNRERA